jgi:hypothetical protein
MQVNQDRGQGREIGFQQVEGFHTEVIRARSCQGQSRVAQSYFAGTARGSSNDFENIMKGERIENGFQVMKTIAPFLKDI